MGTVPLYDPQKIGDGPYLKTILIEGPSPSFYYLLVVLFISW